MVMERRPTSYHRPKFGALLQSDDPILPYTPNNKNGNSSQTSPNYNNDDENNNNNFDVCSSSTSPESNPSSSSPSSSGYASAMTPPVVPVGLFYDNRSNNVAGDSTPYAGMSPWTHHHQAAMSPYTKSPWITSSSLFNQLSAGKNKSPADDVTGLIGSLEREEEGHIYSLAVSGDMLYTGTDSKNIRVWRELNDFSGFKSNSGLVKAIVIRGDRIFTGHQDGKIRVWKKASTSHHKRIGSLPTTKDYLRSYVKVSRRHRNVARIRHFDAVSCMSLNEELGLLYSGSWDKTVKVWRIADSKCLESIVDAHDDAVNSVVDAGFDSLVFTGSADGTVKVWKREQQGKGWLKHSLVETLLKQENAVTALAVNQSSGIVYCGSSDGNVHYWERSKNSKKNYQFSRGGVIPGHKIAVLCLAAAGNLVFSGSADNNISVWRRDVRRGGEHTCLSVLTGHLGPVKCLAVEEAADCGDEKGEKKWMVYSGSLDRSVKVWRVSENAPDLRELFLSEKDETSRPDISNYALTSTTY